MPLLGGYVADAHLGRGKVREIVRVLRLSARSQFVDSADTKACGLPSQTDNYPIFHLLFDR